MSHLRMHRALLAKAALWSALACAPDLAPGACRNYADCRSGETCDLASARCVDDPYAGRSPATPGIPAPDGNNPAPGSGRPVAERLTLHPVRFLSRAPGGGAGELWYSHAGPAGDERPEEQLRVLRAEGSGPDNEVALDLASLGLSPCGVDAVERLGTTEPPELWISCEEQGAVRILYEGWEEQGAFSLPGLADLSLYRPPLAARDPARLLVARRGQSSLRAYQLRTGAGDGLGLGHPFEDGVEAPLAAIGGLWAFDPAGESGDFVWVFVRESGGDAPGARLVPLVRVPQSETWSAAPGLLPMDLPAGTHAVHVHRAPRADGQSATPDVENVITIEPGQGLLRHWNGETQGELLPSLTYETDPTFLAEAPPPQARTLLSASPSGRFVFYAAAGTPRIWRLPVLREDHDQLAHMEVVDPSWRISALVALDDTDVWVAYLNEPRLQRLRVQ